MAAITPPATIPGFPFATGEFLAYWWVFPASILFATIALSSGVSGALFFSPFFILGVGLAPSQAMDPAALKAIFGVGLVILGGFLVFYDPPEEYEPGEKEGAFLREKNTGRGETVIETTDGETYRYETCWRPPGVALATTGAFVTGLISAGLPEITTTQLIIRCRLPPRVAVATSVFVLAITALAGAIVHAMSASPVLYVVAWSVPGVVIGSTIGTRLSRHVPSEVMEPALGVVFALVGIVVVVTEFVGFRYCPTGCDRSLGNPSGIYHPLPLSWTFTGRPRTPCRTPGSTRFLPARPRPRS